MVRPTPGSDDKAKGTMKISSNQRVRLKFVPMLLATVGCMLFGTTCALAGPAGGLAQSTPGLEARTEHSAPLPARAALTEVRTEHSAGQMNTTAAPVALSSASGSGNFPWEASFIVFAAVVACLLAGFRFARTHGVRTRDAA
jgi:hypothetical protein